MTEGGWWRACRGEVRRLPERSRVAQIEEAVAGLKKRMFTPAEL